MVRPRAEYTALQTIPVNGVPGYRAGDDVTAAVVDNLGLKVGEDVEPKSPDVIPRPADDADRPAWEAYAVGQGMPLADAREASLTELRAAYPAEPDRDDVMPLSAKPSTAADAGAKGG